MVPKESNFIKTELKYIGGEIMSCSFKLSLPTDIPWKRICVTEDMMDKVVCDTELPPKWQSSIAVFKYVPEEDYQLFPEYKISYLKMTATIAGYQPLDDEIQGNIDWDGVDVTTIEGLTELLNSYYPCNGSILQVVVGPPGKDPDMSLDKYPFLLDFEPKKRELYEVATDTNEKQSRSIETVHLSKSAGTTQSLEVLDVDMGGSTGFGMQGLYAGTGGGFSFSSSSQGQWGTKSLNTDQSQVTRTVEAGQEKRELYSHTTQLSQMYHLLDSYHLGTNRAVFFVQPRPHVLEEPSGFVRGPRKVEGIQEFFLVVAQPKDQEDFCVSVRMDTAHLMETDILDYDRKTDISDLASAVARTPTRNDIPDGTTTREACFIACWDVTYNCYRTHDVDDQVYTAPSGYIIESYNTIVSEASHGSTSASIAPGNKTLTVHAEANGHICFEGSGVCVDCPDEIEKWSGYARRQVQVNLRSEEPIVPVGKQQQLIITTRGLCCCPKEPISIPDVLVTGVYEIPDYLGGRFYFEASQLDKTAREKVRTLAEARYLTAGIRSSQATGKEKALEESESSTEQPEADSSNGYYERKMSIRQANSMSDFIHDQMIKSFRDPRPGYEPKHFFETDMFFKQLQTNARRTRLGRSLLADKASKKVPESILREVGKQLGKKPDEVKAYDILRFRSHELTKFARIKPSEIAQIKMKLLGIRLKKPVKQYEKKKPRKR